MMRRAGVLSKTGYSTVGWLFFWKADLIHVEELSRRLIHGVTSQVGHVIRNGDPNGYPGCVNLSFAYIEVCRPIEFSHELNAGSGREFVDGFESMASIII